MKSITIESLEGCLQGVLHSPEADDRGYLLLISHGFRGSRDGGGRAVALAEEACRLGFSVVRYDFTPDQLLSCQVRELAGVADFCRRRFGKPLILLGRSMGGSASLAYAASGGQIAGLCLWATPWNLRETFRLALDSSYDKLDAGREVVIEDQWGRTVLIPEFLTDFDRFDLLRDAGKLSANLQLLVVHGTEDPIVPVGRAQELFARAGALKRMAVIEGGDHQFLTGSEQARAAVVGWLDQMFRKV